MAGEPVVSDYETEIEPQRMALPAAADSRSVVAADAERQPGDGFAGGGGSVTVILPSNSWSGGSGIVVCGFVNTRDGLVA